MHAHTNVPRTSRQVRAESRRVRKKRAIDSASESNGAKGRIAGQSDVRNEASERASRRASERACEIKEVS
eukprot:1337363-Pleurochrysis_carterae.AAC.1